MAIIRLDRIRRLFHFDHMSIYRNEIIRCSYRLLSDISYTCIYGYICVLPILKEKLTARRLLSTIIATIGVVIVIGWDFEIGSYFIGTIILVGAAITWALLSIYVKIASARFSSLVITTYAIFFSLFFITPFMVWEFQTNPIEHMNMYVVLGVLYLGIISTAGAFFLWNKGLELMDASIGSLFFFFQPIVGSLLGWFLLNETLSSNFFIGGILIICSVIITTFEKRK